MTVVDPCRHDRGRVDAEGLRHQFGPKKGSAEAKGGRNRLTQRPRGLTQLVEGAVLPVPGFCRAKRFNPSVAGV